MSINNIFRPPVPIEPPVVDFDDLQTGIKYLKQSSDWYRAYAEYLSDLANCKSFDDCLKVSAEINWNQVQDGRFVKEYLIEH